MDFCFHIWNFNGLQSTTIVTKKLFLIVNWSLIDSNWYATSLHPKFALVTHNPWQILVIGTEENTLGSILCSCCRYFGEAIFSISSSITRTLISSSSIPFLSRGLFFSSSLVFFFNFASSIIFIEVSPFKKFGRVLFTFLRFTLLLSRAVR